MTSRPTDVIGTIIKFLPKESMITLAKQRGSYPKQMLLNYKFDLSDPETCSFFRKKDYDHLINNISIDRYDLLKCLLKAGHVDLAIYTNKRFKIVPYKFNDLAAYYGATDYIKVKYENEVPWHILREAIRGWEDFKEPKNYETVTYAYKNALNDHIRQKTKQTYQNIRFYYFFPRVMDDVFDVFFTTLTKKYLKKIYGDDDIFYIDAVKSKILDNVIDIFYDFLSPGNTTPETIMDEEYIENLEPVISTIFSWTNDLYRIDDEDQYTEEYWDLNKGIHLDIREHSLKVYPKLLKLGYYNIFTERQK